MKRTDKGPSFEMETDLFASGYRVIAGVDEAGRGALAGPLSVALVAFSDHFFRNPTPEFSLINDSKILSSAERDEAYSFIKTAALVCRHVFIEPSLVDSLNVNGATKHAIDRLLDEGEIDHLLVDGNFKFTFAVPSVSVKKGDSRSISIAAASIIAKVERDRLMHSIASDYPGYGFETNVGYGAPAHLKGIRELGPTIIHRRSYEPVKSLGK